MPEQFEKDPNQQEPGQQQAVASPKPPADPNNQSSDGHHAKHPIHVIQEILNHTPVDMIEHEYKQGSDGSIEIKIKIPGRAEQAKQRAMQQAEQVMSGANAGNSTLDQIVETPQASPAGSSNNSPGGDSMASKANVTVKVAMTPQDIGMGLKSKFPEKFLKEMGLL